jgi:hypothetical protein
MGCAERARPVEAPISKPRETAVVEGDDPGFPSAVERAPVVTASNSPSDRLIAESTRQQRAMTTTSYRHRSHIDEASGTFEYDCSGFVAYALLNAAPDALARVPVGPKGRPRAEEFVTYFAGLEANDPFEPVRRASDIAPGDIIAWLRPEDVNNTNTGHIAIVLDRLGIAAPSSAAAKIGGARELLFRVVDSTEAPHGDDVRDRYTMTGLGTGTIGLVVDGSDTPIGYRWKGGESPRAHATMIAVARLR